MPITIELTESTERILAERAAKYGQSLEVFAAKVLDRASRQKSLDEVLAPFRQEVAESGMTEDEFGAFIEEIRDEIWEEKHGGKG
jgi:predicted metalloprotease with PDZ domain